MKIIVGLGNPGSEYQNSRHNTGFKVVDEIMQKSKIKNQSQKSNVKSSDKFKAEVHEIEINKEKILLVKPQTSMNSSGEAIKKILKFNNLTIEQCNNALWVVHDDIDLPLGTLRIVRNRGSAGHKGVESVIRELATKDFVRFRIGIGKTTEDKKEFVLGNFSGEDRKLFAEMVARAAEALLFSLENGIEKAMNKYNSKED